jgi:hypothetical protein
MLLWSQILFLLLLLGAANPSFASESFCSRISDFSAILLKVRGGEQNLKVAAPSHLLQLKGKLDAVSLLLPPQYEEKTRLQEELKVQANLEIKEILTVLSGLSASGAEKSIIWRTYAVMLRPFLLNWVNHWRELESKQIVFTGTGDHILLFEPNGQMWRGKVTNDATLGDIKYGRQKKIDPLRLKLWKIDPTFKR